MNPNVQFVDVNILDGILRASIEFTNGLNILSGENGTFKTQILKKIKEGTGVRPGTVTTPRIQAFSPQRTSERKNVEKIFNEIRQPNRRFTNYLQKLTATVFQDATFVIYPPFGEVYLLVYEEEIKGGKTAQPDKMKKVTDDFNSIIRRIFENYEIVSTWDGERGSPNIRIKKYNDEIPIESLSLGEQEILALVINLYATKESHDVFLIDEPEIHLNWHLEERLFNYFNWFCNEYDKQIILATHSRLVFTAPFRDKTQFLFWQNGHINIGREIPHELQTRIAGESIGIITVGALAKRTFFVEDARQVEVIENIAKVMKANLVCQICGSSSIVRSLYKLSLSQVEWSNCLFIEDGDNEGNPFPDDKKFIHLDKYCIENYLFDVKTAMIMTNKEETEVKKALLNAIKANKNKLLRRNKYFAFFGFLLDKLSISSINEESISVLDGSKIFDSYIKELEINPNVYIKQYIEVIYKESRLDKVFPKELISAIGAQEQNK